MVYFLVICLQTGLLYAYSEGDIVITEFFFRSRGDLPDYIEIINTNSFDINLKDWSLELNSGSFSISSDYIIFGSSYLIITATGNFMDSFGDFYFAENDPGRDANNTAHQILSESYWLDFEDLGFSSDNIQIFDPTNQLIDRVNFDTSFPVGIANRGHAAEFMLNPLDNGHNLNDLGANWGKSQHTAEFLYNGNNTDPQIGYGSPRESNFAPVNFQLITPADDQSFNFIWENAFVDDEGDELYGVTHFNLFREKDIDNTVVTTQVDVNTTQHIDNTPASGALYHYSINAVAEYDGVQFISPSAAEQFSLAIPAANAGSDQNITLLPSENTKVVTLTGAYSDPEGDAVTFEWIEDGSIISTMQSFTQTVAPGTFNYTFKVTDSHAAFGMDNIQVIVMASLVADAGDSIFIALKHDFDPGGSATVNLDGSGSYALSSYSIISYSWEINNEVIASGASDQASVMLDEGDYEIVLVVTEAGGATATDTVFVSIVEDNNAPIIKLTDSEVEIIIPNESENPGNAAPVILSEFWNSDSTYDPDGDEFLDAYGNPPNNPIPIFWVKIAIDGETHIPDIFGDPTLPDTSTTGIVVLDAAEYIFTLNLMDNYGAVGTDTLTLYMLEQNEKPVVEVTGSPHTFEESEVTLTAVVTDENNCSSSEICSESDLGIEPFEWDCVDDQNIVIPHEVLGTTVESISSSIKFNSPTIATNEPTDRAIITCKLTATDQFGDSGKDSLRINVYNYNQIPEVTQTEILTEIEQNSFPLTLSGAEILLGDIVIANVVDPDNDQDFILTIIDNTNYNVDGSIIKTLEGNYDILNILIQVDDQINALAIEGLYGDLLHYHIGEAELIVNINPVNGTPIISLPYEVFPETILEDASDITINGLSISDPDVTADGFNITVGLKASSGSFKLGTAGSGNFAQVLNNDTTQIPFDVNSYYSDLIITARIFNDLANSDINQIIENIYYLPGTDFYGIDALEIIVDDLGYIGFGGNKTATDQIIINIAGENDAPVALDDTFYIDEDTDLFVPPHGILTNEYANNFNEEEMLYADIVSNVQFGSLIPFDPTVFPWYEDGSFTYEPYPNWNGTDFFSYKVNDGVHFPTDVVTVYIVVNPVNDLPVTDPDTYSLTEDETLTVTSINGLLINDDDLVEDSPLTAILYDPPSFGQITTNDTPLGINESFDGTFKFIPADDYYGAVYFTYAANDGSDSSTEDGAPAEEVLLTIIPQNDAPVNTSLPTIVGKNQLGQQLSLDIGEWNDNKDTDPCSGIPEPTECIGFTSALNFNYLWERTSDISLDNVTTIQDWSTDSTYILTSNDMSTATVPKYIRTHVEALDNGIPGITSTTVVTNWRHVVNTNPVAVADTVTFFEDDETMISEESVFANDIDPEENSADGQNTLIGNMITEPLLGSLSFEDATGLFTYDPDTTENWHGTDSFTYRVFDGQFESTGTVTIIVQSVNDAPGFTLSTQSISMVEDQSESVMISVTPDHSIIPYNETGQVVTYSLNHSITSANLDIDSATGKVTISTISNKNTDNENVTVEVIGQDAIGSDIAEYFQSFTLKIVPLNDPPAFTLSPPELTNLVEDQFSQRIVSVIQSVIPDDETSQPVSYTLTPSSINGVEIEYSSETGLIIFTKITDGNTSWYPDSTVSFSITAEDFVASDPSSDSTYNQSFNFKIKSINDRPKFHLNNDLITIDTLSGQFTLLLEEDFPQNQYIYSLMEAIPDDETLQPITYSISPTSSELFDLGFNTNTGQLTVSSFTNIYGSQRLTVTADDGQGQFSFHQEVLDVVVQSVNDPPTIDSIEDFIIPEDTTTYILNLTGISTGADNEQDTIAIEAYSSAPEIIPHPGIDYFGGQNNPAYSGPNSTGILEFTPVSEMVGEVIISVLLIDNGNASLGSVETGITFKVTVEEINDPPIFYMLEDTIIVNEDFPKILISDSTGFVPEDELGQTVTYSLDPDFLSFADIEIDILSGVLQITAVPDSNTQDVPGLFQEIIIIANDHSGGNEVYRDTISLRINPVNDAPVFSMDSLLVLNEDAYEIDSVVVHPVDPPLDERDQAVFYTLTPEIVDFAHITFDTTTGTIHIAKIENKNTYLAGTDSTQVFTVMAFDNGGVVPVGIDSFSFDFKLRIHPVNDPPLFSIPDIELDEDFNETLIDITPGSVPQDELIQIVQYSIEPEDIGIAGLEIEIDENDAVFLKVTKRNDQYGETTFKIIAIDDGDEETAVAKEEVQLIVLNVNDPPLYDGPQSISAMEDFINTLPSFTVEDIDVYAKDMKIKLSVSKGYLSLADTNGLTFSIGVGVNDSTIEVTGTKAAINNAVSALVYQSFENYNGSDTLNIVMNDLGHSGSGGPQIVTVKKDISITPVNDPPVIDSIVFKDLAILSEDTSGVEFLVTFSDIDTDSNLNADPFSTDNLVWTFDKLDSESEQRAWAFETDDVFMLDSLLPNFNGITGLKVTAHDIGNGHPADFQIISRDLEFVVKQRNDQPSLFNLQPDLHSYTGIDSSAFEFIGAALYFRLPQSTSLISSDDPDSLRFQWDFVEYLDIDIHPDLNLDNPFLLYYRLELFSAEDEHTIVLADSILHQDFTSDENIWVDIDTQEKYPIYFGNYEDETPLDSTVRLDLNGNTPYYWRVVAQNYQKDEFGNDPPQISSGVNDTEIRIDIEIPSTDFIMMTNDIYPDYYDLFFEVDEALRSAESYLYINGSGGFHPRTMTDSLYHFTGVFSDTGMIVYDFHARDSVLNLGISKDSVNYQIASPRYSSFIYSPSSTALLHIPEDGVESEIGILVREKKMEDDIEEMVLERDSWIILTQTVHIEPEEIQLQNPASIRFNISDHYQTEFESWKYKIIKITDDEMNILKTYFTHGEVSAIIESLGNYAVIIDPAAELPLPEKFQLGACYPNPFNPSTTIPLAIPVESRLKVSIFNILGQEVNVLLNGIQSPGYRQITWNGKNHWNQNVGSGIYFVQVIFEKQVYNRKIILLK